MIVPLWEAFSPAVKSLTQRLLAFLAPEWCEIQIAEYARYLGVLIGPGVTLDIQWKAAFDIIMLFASCENTFSQAFQAAFGTTRNVL